MARLFPLIISYVYATYLFLLDGVLQRFGSASHPLALLLFTQVFLGIIANGFRDPDHPNHHEPSLSTLALIELVKVVLSGLLLSSEKSTFLHRRPVSHVNYALVPHHGNSHPDLPLRQVTCEQLFDTNEASDPLEETEWYPVTPRPHHYPKTYTQQWSTSKGFMILTALSLTIVANNLVISLISSYADTRTARVVNLSLVLFTVAHMYFILDKPIRPSSLTTALLQVTTVLLVEWSRKMKIYNTATYALLFSSTWLSSIILIAMHFVYNARRDVSIHKTNFIMFTLTLIGYCLCFGVFRSLASTDTVTWPGIRNSIACGLSILLRAVRDIATVLVLRDTSPFIFCAVTLLSTSLIPPLSYLCLGAADGHHLAKWAAMVLAIYAAASYLFEPAIQTGPSVSPSNRNTQPPRPSAVVFLLVMLFTMSYAFSTSSLRPLSHKSDFVWKGSLLGSSPLMPHQVVPVQSNSVEFSDCKRNPLPPSTVFPGPGERPKDFHVFDDVLLVVFFSHPRYDVNLEGYREVYSKYFPNILFVGPTSREDRGFRNSYDVFVDSYHSDEDYGVGWYKMGGRMAHHMFYTAVMNNPCYAGYLWAPFDAFLNVARLAQFPQDQIWYHSPYGQYIPNPAVSWELPEKHAPPANISKAEPQKYIDQTSDWGAGWHGWWGERNVGLRACLPAYNELPQRFRNRLQNLTGTPDRFFLASADTMYVPAHLREDLLDTLGMFLQTECFLEIAMPTTLHMILPEGENIAYVDHWWSNDPPFDTTLIRQKWKEGYEVDTFHSFHWGHQRDGEWVPFENTVEDVRSVLEDSFIRQGMDIV